MERLDAVLLGIVFGVWGALALMYATIPMIYMPSGIRVWGSGAFLFLVLTAVTVVAGRKGKDRRRANARPDPAGRP